MTTALTKLYMYFGVIGIASTLTWASCWLVTILFARSRRRTQVLWIVLVIAMIGLALAKVNSLNVSAIKLDQTAEIEAGRKRAEELIQMEEEEEEEDIDEDESIYAQAAVGTTAPYAYRSRGKQTRDEGKRRENADAIGDLIETDAEERMMKAPDKNRANLLDRLNLFSARATMWLAIIFVLLDYLSRFNATFKTYLPLPISCRFLDAIFPKAGSICIREADAYTLAQYLQTAVVKGDTFIYFGVNDPWADPQGQGPEGRVALPRLCMPKLEKLHCADGTHHDNDFVFESVWFRRFCVVATGEEFSTRWLHELITFLTLRHDVLAAARHTIHVVWHHASPPPPDVVDELLFLCGETNCSFVLASAEQQPDAESQFAELYDKPLSMPIVPRAVPIHRQLTQSTFQLRLNEIETSREAALKSRVAREAAKEAAKEAAREAAEKEAREEASRLAKEKAKAQIDAAKQRPADVKEPSAAKHVTEPPKPSTEPTTPKPSAPEQATPVTPPQAAAPATPPKPKPEPSRPAVTPPAPSGVKGKDLARRIADKKAAKLEAQRLAKEKAMAQIAAARGRAKARKEEPATPEQKSFFFQCPSCQQKIAAEPTWIGQTSACPTCGKAITIPDPNAPAPQSPEPTQAPAEPQSSEFKFMCPGCDQKLSAEPDWAGMQLECPKCGKGLIVPPPPS